LTTTSSPTTRAQQREFVDQEFADNANANITFYPVLRDCRYAKLQDKAVSLRLKDF
jgi:hypothetical protein